MVILFDLILSLCYPRYYLFSHANDFKVVPIVVGSLSFAAEKMFGEILAPYLADPNTLFVISSDFCHWGELQVIFLVSNHNMCMPI